jgi:hypothetical protein
MEVGQDQKLKAELKDILHTHMLNTHQLALLRLGHDCNAATTQSFTEAKCYMDTIKKPDTTLTLTIAFTRFFRPGISLLKDYIEDKKRSFSDYEKIAIQKLFDFLKDKGKTCCVNKVRYSRFIASSFVI